MMMPTKSNHATRRKTCARRPPSVRYAFYEAEKWLWSLAHPHSTAIEYDQAMTLIAKRCGV